MKTALFILSVVLTLYWLWWRSRLPPVRAYGYVDAIVPAYNEEVCIIDTVKGLMKNPYFNRIIVVNDGSTDRTFALLNMLAIQFPRLTVIHQKNTGKGGALMAGVAATKAPMVFLTDADTMLPADGDGIGYMMAEIKRGADAVGGLPSSNLTGAGLLPHIRATCKDPMIVIMRTFQQIVGGAPFIVSGACGLFRTEVLRAVPFSDRTKVEDLDLSWTLVAKGYKLRLTSRCIVYSQECNKLKAEWLRWRRWIVGYAVCMRLHRKLLLSRFGLFTILPMFLVVVFGIAAFIVKITPILLHADIARIPVALFPVLWTLVSYVIATVSALHHRRFWLIPLAPIGIVYLLGVYLIWFLYGLPAFFTGREPSRDKPTRYANVVG